jgi:hypothetical protein
VLDSGEFLGKVRGVVATEIDDSVNYVTNNADYGYEER